jgi:LacI family transcriptional regulator
MIYGPIMQKNITIKNIAHAADVHVSTVSRALSQNSQASLSPAVVTKIRKLAKEMGYRPNRMASGLRTKRTMTVGIIIPDIENTLFPPIVRGIESVLEPAGYASILVNTDDNAEREHKLFNLLIDRGVDGIIDAAVTRLDKIYERMSHEIAIVTANRMIEGSGIPAVINDDSGGIRMVFRKLYEIGHRHIAHISGPMSLSTGVQRRAAFEVTCKAIDLHVPQSMIVTAQRYSEEEGQRCAAEVIGNNPDVTALLCANDRLAIGAIEAAAKMGLRCPDDISVTGFNDIPFLELMTPALTTVKILQFDVGQISAETLLKKMTEPTAPVPEKMIMPVMIIERDSVAPPKQNKAQKLKRKMKEIT